LGGPGHNRNLTREIEQFGDAEFGHFSFLSGD
jgi:hypothetical protein